jgi:hypothetical protein
MQPKDGGSAWCAAFAVRHCVDTRGKTVEANWITTTSALPTDGTPVEFVLDGRECPMRGNYVLGHFESRWSKYEPECVREWRCAGEQREAFAS